MKYLPVFLVLLLPWLTKAEMSAIREEGLDYHHYIPADKGRGETPLKIARPYKVNEVDDVSNWSSYSELRENFEHMRDVRFFEWYETSRRSSWLYPDDGCYARAALANRNLKDVAKTLPNKIFVFGNLKVETENSPKGYVTWWYHVAPMVEIRNRNYILDPAIEASRPLRLKEWLSRMGSPHELQIAICYSGAYGPKSICHKISDGQEDQANAAQRYYLTMEWYRLLDLGRSPEVELGNQPPWD